MLVLVETLSKGMCGTGTNILHIVTDRTDECSIINYVAG
jgi:hypothetical protein